MLLNGFIEENRNNMEDYIGILALRFPYGRLRNPLSLFVQPVFYQIKLVSHSDLEEKNINMASIWVFLGNAPKR